MRVEVTGHVYVYVQDSYRRVDGCGRSFVVPCLSSLVRFPLHFVTRTKVKERGERTCVQTASIDHADARCFEEHRLGSGDGREREWTGK